TRGSFRARRIHTASRARNVCRMLCQLRSATRRQLDRYNRTAALFAHRFSTDWRGLARYGDSITRGVFAQGRSRSLHLSAFSSAKPRAKAGRRIVEPAVRSDDESWLKRHTPIVTRNCAKSFMIHRAKFPRFISKSAPKLSNVIC